MLLTKFIGKPYAGKPHVRFDEGVGKVIDPSCSTLLLKFKSLNHKGSLSTHDVSQRELQLGRNEWSVRLNNYLSDKKRCPPGRHLFSNIVI
jgi:hypothetical protein